MAEEAPVVVNLLPRRVIDTWDTVLSEKRRDVIAGLADDWA